jgi:hypothetical protein
MKLPQLTRRQWLIVAVVVLALVAAIGYFIYRRRKDAQAAASAPVAGEAKVLPIVPAPVPALFADCPNDSFPLKLGKCGKRVEQFQLYLIKQYGAKFSTYGVDGKWGEETQLLAKRYILKNEPFSISEEYFNKTGMYSYNTIRYA